MTTADDARLGDNLRAFGGSFPSYERAVFTRFAAEADSLEAAARDVDGRMLRNLERETARAEKAEAERDAARRELDELRQRVEGLADDLDGEAEWIENNFMPGPNSTGAAEDLRAQGDRLRAALGGAS